MSLRAKTGNGPGYITSHSALAPPLGVAAQSAPALMAEWLASRRTQQSANARLRVLARHIAALLPAV